MSMTPDRQYELTMLEREFAEKMLSREKLDAFAYRCDEITEKSRDVKQLEADTKEINEKTIVKKFEANPVTDSELRRMDELKKEYLETEEYLKAEESAENKTINVKNTPYKAFIIIIIIGILLLVGGIVCAFFNIYAGIAVCTVGIITLISLIFIKAEPKNYTQRRSIELTAKINLIKNELNELLSSKGYYSKDGVLVGLANFSHDYGEYERLRNNKEEKSKELEKANKDLRDLSESLKIELVNYGYGDKDIKTAISLLDKKYTEYVSLKNERDYYARHAEEVKQQIDVEEKFFTEFFATYKIDGDKNELLENMRSDRFVVDNLKTKLKKLNDEISEFDGIPEAIS